MTCWRQRGRSPQPHPLLYFLNVPPLPNEAPYPLPGRLLLARELPWKDWTASSSPQGPIGERQPRLAVIRQRPAEGQDLVLVLNALLYLNRRESPFLYTSFFTIVAAVIYLYTEYADGL
ncbi:hypothetical protein NDU88_003784 [Pleurodeles waltl]|uniref:Uncharacterized protein n=1 Tax=Pleurodeles waltl TaxID=8319 RepID=A0AAV7SGZ7_PLEWA|nr:hypothetical protein NDU88_003784 [Pleurodeles waltl]